MDKEQRARVMTPEERADARERSKIHLRGDDEGSASHAWAELLRAALDHIDAQEKEIERLRAEVKVRGRQAALLAIDNQRRGETIGWALMLVEAWREEARKLCCRWVPVRAVALRDCANQLERELGKEGNSDGN